ncbi:MAG: hypothetical protein ABSA53_21495 [Streptosporangiaceae bacterium]|jgi:hypothetical protein
MTIAHEGTRATGSTAAESEAVLPQYEGQDPADKLSIERIVVALVPKVMGDLKLLQDRTSLSRTDIANRAITLYEFIDQQVRAGHEILIRETCTGKTRAVLIL